MHIFSPCMLKNIFITGASGSVKTTVIIIRLQFVCQPFPTNFLLFPRRDLTNRVSFSIIQLKQMLGEPEKAEK